MLTPLLLCLSHSLSQPHDILLESNDTSKFYYNFPSLLPTVNPLIIFSLKQLAALNLPASQILLSFIFSH